MATARVGTMEWLSCTINTCRCSTKSGTPMRVYSGWISWRMTSSRKRSYLYLRVLISSHKFKNSFQNSSNEYQWFISCMVNSVYKCYLHAVSWSLCSSIDQPISNKEYMLLCRLRYLAFCPSYTCRNQSASQIQLTQQVWNIKLTWLAYIQWPIYQE